MVFFDISTGNQKAAESMQDENLQGGEMDFNGNNNLGGNGFGIGIGNGNGADMQDFGTSSDLQGYNPRNNVNNEMFVSENIGTNHNFNAESNMDGEDLFGNFNEPTDSNFQQLPSNVSDPFANMPQDNANFQFESQNQNCNMSEDDLLEQRFREREQKINLLNHHKQEEETRQKEARRVEADQWLQNQMSLYKNKARSTRDINQAQNRQELEMENTNGLDAGSSWNFITTKIA